MPPYPWIGIRRYPFPRLGTPAVVTGKNKERFLFMSLKLHSLRPEEAHGDIDGLPFRFRRSGRRWSVFIDGYEDHGEIAHPAPLISEIRGLIYMAVARYRAAGRRGLAA